LVFVFGRKSGLFQRKARTMMILDETRFHLYSLGDLHILIGSNGGLYLIDDAAYDRLSREKDSLASLHDDSLSRELKEIDRLEGPCHRFTPPAQRELRALCLNITYECNMRCIYCFTRKRQHQRGSMTMDTAKRAIDFLMERAPEKAVLQVDFFGGEPLLNFDILMQCTAYARKKAHAGRRQIKFTVTTNGILLDGKVGEYLNREGFSVILSIDGPPAINDIHRPLMSGQPSWNTIFNNIENFLKSRDFQDYYVRGTYTPLSLELTETARFYISRGLSNFSLEPARGPAGTYWAVSKKELPYLQEEYEKLALFARSCKKEGTPFNFFHFNVHMDAPICVTRRLTGCGAGVEYLSVGTEGELYPCHQFHGLGEFSMGTLFDSTPAPSFIALKEKMEQAHVYQKSSCSSCWARLYCSGGCHASSYFDSGDILKPDPVGCALQKKRLECALWLKACETSGAKTGTRGHGVEERKKFHLKSSPREPCLPPEGGTPES
jgi:uncharacterized protein